VKGTLRAICLSREKGTPKTAVQVAELVADHGLRGDAHAGPWHRQVSLLDCAEVAAMRQKLPEIGPGAFAENLTLEGLDCSSLGLGTRLRLGAQAEIRLSQLGKVCHSRCAIYHETGDCIMPRLGLFARVLKGGSVAVADPVEVLELVPRERFQVVVLTVSDRCAAGSAEDTAGPAAAAAVEQELGAHTYRTEVVPDESGRIAERLKHYCDGHSLDLVLTVGGTGFSPRDVTPEATRPLLERFTPGLDEAMRAASLRSLPQAMLSRGVSGIRGATLIVNLPGSREAATENLRAILPALGHGLRKLRGDPTDCASPEPRQGEE
jgi:molybdenum cofactor synthesis domain-containing protein